MNNIRIQEVWFADEKKNSSVTKLLVITDRGALEVASSSLHFWGRKLQFPLSSIKDISLVRQQFSWVSYAIMNLLMVLYFMFLVRLFPNLYSYPFLLLMLVGLDIFGLAVSYNTKWIRVEYYDDQKQTHKAFFADGSTFGWGGIFGGTEKMYRTLKGLVSREESATV